MSSSKQALEAELAKPLTIVQLKELVRTKHDQVERVIVAAKTEREKTAAKLKDITERVSGFG